MPVQRQWLFSPRGFNDVEQEVTEGDQFNTETVPDTEALVREATQNSQDARLSAAPVRLRFALADASSGLDAGFLREITDGLHPHLKESRLPLAKELADAPAALIVEDFGTEGLTGRIDDEQDPGNFRSFWFRHGRSFKSGNKNGRWGLGKLVYPMMSGARCLFGLTIRHNDPAPLLLGQAVLRNHYIDDHRFAPHGHFGDTSGGDLRPITEAAYIDRFRKAFGLTRTTEAGLSVVVPFPRSAVDRDALIHFVVQNYAYPILTERLVIEVLGETIDADGVRALGKTVLAPGLVEFIDDAHNFTVNKFIGVKPRPRGSRDRLTEDLVQGDVPALRENYGKGELIGFRVPVSLGRKNSTKHESHVAVFFRRADHLPEGKAIYVRGDITVPDEAAQFKGPTVFAMLLAQDDSVSEFLADAENPAHTKWVATSARVKENWTWPGETLWQIRNAPVALHKMLATGKERVDATALMQFFWIDDPDRTPDRRPGPPKRRKPDEPPGPSPVPPLPAAQRKLMLQKRKGGFTLKPGPGFADVALPATARISVRYDVEYGQPKWDPLDFDFAAGDIAVTATGAEAEALENTVTLTIEDHAFELTVEGFDEKRDLMVDYNLLKARETEDA